MPHIQQIPNTDVDFWKYIQSHINDNEILLASDILKALNALSLQYNIPLIKKDIATTKYADDLPF